MSNPFSEPLQVDSQFVGAVSGDAPNVTSNQSAVFRMKCLDKTVSGDTTELDIDRADSLRIYIDSK